jgi:hypothetical protein
MNCIDSTAARMGLEIALLACLPVGALDVEAVFQKDRVATASLTLLLLLTALAVTP